MKSNTVNLTAAQEEALYKKFVDRYGEELSKRYGSSKRGTNTALSEARDYFHDVLNRESQKNPMLKPSLYGHWDKITKLTCAVFGVSYIYDIPYDRREFANEFTIEIASIVVQGWLTAHGKDKE